MSSRERPPLAPLRRVSITVPLLRAEEARAQMLDLFPDGFEELDYTDGIELVAYTDAGGEERLWHAFSGVRGEDVAADWADRWRAFHKPVRIGPLWVGPPWEEPDNDALPVIIDPGRAFGTGAHPTTRLCLGFLADLPRTSLLDVGCGSGVLSIGAARLGFAPVIAIDLDPAAVEATEENARVNQVAVDTRLADGLDSVLPTTDLVVANITAASVEELLQRCTAPGLVVSGFLVSDLYDRGEYAQVERRQIEGWAADLLRREK